MLQDDRSQCNAEDVQKEGEQGEQQENKTAEKKDN
jgi:hypothetical protein